MMLEDVIGSMVRLEKIQASLKPQIFSTGSGSFADFNMIVIAPDGGGTITVDETQLDLEASSIIAVPHNKKAKLKVASGHDVWITGYHQGLAPIVSGTDLDSHILEMLSVQITVAAMPKCEIAACIIPALKILEREIERKENRSQSVISSLMRILLTNAYRYSANKTFQTDIVTDDSVVQRFRHIVELEFRNRKPVSYYCEKLSITYDRLHDICNRNLNKSPLQLINNRTLIEATNRLQKTNDTIQVIANSLGYNEASQFSHFFKKSTGFSPKEFRNRDKLKLENNEKGTKIEFSDWP